MPKKKTKAQDPFALVSEAILAKKQALESRGCGPIAADQLATKWCLERAQEFTDPFAATTWKAIIKEIENAKT